jgi:hypothetical protein
MPAISITFEHKGKSHSGKVVPVMGAGELTIYHLMVDNYYWGRLRMSNGKWVFDTVKVPELTGMFESWMTAQVPSIH